MEKKYPLESFPKEMFSIYFEHIRNSRESQIRELKNIKSFSSLEHGPKSDKSASALQKCFHLCQKC